MLLNNADNVNDATNSVELHWSQVAKQYLVVGLYPEMLTPEGYRKVMQVQLVGTKKGSHQRIEATVIFDRDYACDYLIRFLNKRMPGVCDGTLASFLDAAVVLLASRNDDADQFFLENF